MKPAGSAALKHSRWSLKTRPCASWSHRSGQCAMIGVLGGESMISLLLADGGRLPALLGDESRQGYHGAAPVGEDRMTVRGPYGNSFPVDGGRGRRSYHRRRIGQAPFAPHRIRQGQQKDYAGLTMIYGARSSGSMFRTNLPGGECECATFPSISRKKDGCTTSALCPPAHEVNSSPENNLPLPRARPS